MKKTFLLVSAMIMAGAGISQEKYFTRDGHIKFFSSTPMEDIEADNHKVTSVLDEASGKIEFAANMKSFEFEKALMEEHFNENYVESKEYPKAVFKGSLKGFKMGDYSAKTEIIAAGTMTMHGVSKEIEIPGTIEFTGGNYHLVSKFMISPEDYNIEIPNTVRDNIAKEMEVTVDAKLGPLSKK
jgi:polyisoprenoid-binding protein YceI